MLKHIRVVGLESSFLLQPFLAAVGSHFVHMAGTTFKLWQLTDTVVGTWLMVTSLFEGV